MRIYLLILSIILLDIVQTENNTNEKCYLKKSSDTGINKIYCTDLNGFYNLNLSRVRSYYSFNYYSTDTSTILEPGSILDHNTKRNILINYIQIKGIDIRINNFQINDTRNVFSVTLTKSNFDFYLEKKLLTEKDCNLNSSYHTNKSIFPYFNTDFICE